MNPHPFKDQSLSVPREAPVDTLGLDLECCLEIAVDRMEMRYAMLVIEHTDHYPKKSRDLRHR